MNTTKSSSYLHQFSWEEWDNQLIVVLYRYDRRFVVKRYIERVLANSPQWQQLSQSSFSNIEPIAKAYTMTENEVKLIHHIFSWHLNGVLTFPIIGGLDQLLDWEDVLDFIQRAKQVFKNDTLTSLNSPSLVPTIPVGTLSSTLFIKKPVEKGDSTPITTNKQIRQQQLFDENTSLSSSNHWVQLNNLCLPYIIKSQQTRLLPYQVIIDCGLLTEQEQIFLLRLTIKANLNDIQTFERIISSSSSIDFTLDNDLLLIDLYHLIFGISKIIYIKLLNNQRDVNKSYKTVLAQCGGNVIFQSNSIPFISLRKDNYILLDSLVTSLQLSRKTLATLRRHALSAQAHEIDYLRLVQFYQRKDHEDNSIVSNQQEQSLISIDHIHKYASENEFVIDMLLPQYQLGEYQKLRKQIEVTENKSARKPTKRKSTIGISELQNTATER